MFLSLESCERGSKGIAMAQVLLSESGVKEPLRIARESMLQALVFLDASDAPSDMGLMAISHCAALNNISQISRRVNKFNPCV